MCHIGPGMCHIGPRDELGHDTHLVTSPYVAVKFIFANSAEQCTQC